MNQREIKFRAWDRVKKTMLPPDDMGYQIQMPNGDYFDADVYYLQYTTLKDSAGTEIYEGDIYKTFYKYKNIAAGRTDNVRIIGVVEFASGAFQVRGIGKNKGTTASLIEKGQLLGNIFENPELLSENAIISPPKTPEA